MSRAILERTPPPYDERISYGGDYFQFADLRLPDGPGRHPVVVTIHGGFWRPLRTLDYFGEACASLVREGYATWNLEYRRVGHAGGGWPGTFDDIRNGFDHLLRSATELRIDTARVFVMGHSAGGHLALCLCAERRDVVRGVISLAGVSDFCRALELKLGENAAGELIGNDHRKSREACPTCRVPLGRPSRLIHGTQDEVLPVEISERFVQAAVAAGDDSLLHVLPGRDHFDIVDPMSPVWPHVLQTLRRLDD